MKRLLYISVLILFATFSFSSCEKNNSTTPTYQTFAAFLQSQPTLSSFAKGLDRAQLESFKSGPGPFTWFAPTNDAFIAAGVDVNLLTPGQLNYILLYHLINAEVTKKDMIAQTSFARTTQMGSSVFLGTNGDSSFINGTSVISSENRVDNGIINIINRVNIPPNLRGNIQSILTTTGQHSLFIAALTKANRWTLVGGTSIFTVLAPTDAAMTAAGYTLTTINASTVGKIDSIVRYHLFSGSRLFTNDFGNVTSQSTFLGTTSSVQPSSFGRKIKGKNNPTPLDIITSDLTGTNGVVHIINGVLRY